MWDERGGPRPGSGRSSHDYRARADALRGHLTACQLDAALLTDAANIAYFAGYTPEHFFLTRSRMLALIVPASGPVIAIAPASHVQDVREQTGIAHVVGYSGLLHAPVEEMGHALDALGVRRLGLELGTEQRINMTALDLAALRERVRAEIVDIAGAVWALRMVKSASEIALVEQACRIGEEAWRRCLPVVRPGVSERAVATQLASEVALLGGRLAFLIMTSGRGAYHRSNGAPRDRVLRDGDILFADIGVCCDGYHADFNRCMAAGRPAPEQTLLQQRVAEVTERAGRHLVPGTRAAEVYARVLDDCRAAGLSITPPGRVGHGLGLGVTEPPHISREDDTPLADGMVITIEPAVERDDGLFCAECLYAVTPGGGRRLNASGARLDAVKGSGA